MVVFRARYDIPIADFHLHHFSVWKTLDLLESWLGLSNVHEDVNK